jgi:hypothetical protein
MSRLLGPLYSKNSSDVTIIMDAFAILSRELCFLVEIKCKELFSPAEHRVLKKYAITKAKKIINGYLA